MNKDPMTSVYSPNNELELLMILSVLEGEGISSFVKNNHFGSLKIGPKIDLLNGKWILVPNDQSERAKELIDDYLQVIQGEKTEKSVDYSGVDKARCLAEFFLFDWVMPGNAYLLKNQSWFMTLLLFSIMFFGAAKFLYIMSLWFLTYQ